MAGYYMGMTFTSTQRIWVLLYYTHKMSHSCLSEKLILCGDTALLTRALTITTILACGSIASVELNLRFGGLGQ